MNRAVEGLNSCLRLFDAWEPDFALMKVRILADQNPITKKGLSRRRDNPFSFLIESRRPLELGRASHQKNDYDQRPQGHT